MYQRRSFIITILLILILSVHVQVQAQELERYQFSSRHMGTQFNIILYADDDSVANRAAEEAFALIEELNQIMSDYVDDSELNRLSRTSGSGKEVEISSDLFEVLAESVRMSELSSGLFDVTIGPLTKLWRMVRMSPEPALPANEEIEELQQSVGTEYIKLDEDNQTAELLRPGMQLDLGGIAKGYAAGEALGVLNEHGIYSALIDAGGDVTLGDPPPGRDTWEVAVPKSQKEGENRFITLYMSKRTVTTSGDLFQYVMIDGKRYSHILNPKTGLGSTRQIQATVIAPEGMKADALASILTLMEPEEGIRFINNLDETEAILFVNRGGDVQEYRSDEVEQFMD